MKDLGVHDLGSGLLVLCCRFTTSAHPKSQAQSSNFAEFVTLPHLGRMNLLETTCLVCAAHHHSVASASDSLPARFESLTKWGGIDRVPRYPESLQIE